jgi:hypothetical protein
MGDKKKEKDKKIVHDDFYDKINYRESRNIFSSNEVFNPENRLYTENAAFTHALWEKIKRPGGDEDIPAVKATSSSRPKKYENKSEGLTDTILNSINKLNTSTSYQPVGCKKCGHGKDLLDNLLVGHYAYQCFNSIKLTGTSNLKKDGKI